MNNKKSNNNRNDENEDMDVIQKETEETQQWQY